MDDFDDRLTGILMRVQTSSLSDTEKADAYAAIHNGLQTLVWPILVSHIPESDLKEVIDHPETLTVTRYGELVGKALEDPETAREIHTEIIAALTEIEALVASQLPKSPKT